MKQVSVVIGSFNRRKFLRLVIDSVRFEIDRFGLDAEIIVVDGGSNDGSLDWLVSQKDVISIIQHNRGLWRGREIKRRSWGYFMNLGFRAAQGKYICMLSDDCLVVPGALNNGVKHLDACLNSGRRIGAGAFYWRNWPDQKTYWVGLTLGNKLFVNHGLYLRDAVEQIGFIDEETCFFYHADGDLCLKMWQAGYEVVPCPDSFIEHYAHANEQVRTSNLERQSQDWANYTKKWSGIYFDPKLNNVGDWSLQEFHDETQTARLFRSALPWSLRVRSALKSLKRRYW